MNQNLFIFSQIHKTENWNVYFEYQYSCTCFSINVIKIQTSWNLDACCQLTNETIQIHIELISYRLVFSSSIFTIISRVIKKTGITCSTWNHYLQISLSKYDIRLFITFKSHFFKSNFFQFLSSTSCSHVYNIENRWTDLNRWKLEQQAQKNRQKITTGSFEIHNLILKEIQLKIDFYFIFLFV